MLKKSLIGLAVVALMVSVAQAGVAKYEDWPGSWICIYEGDSQEVCTLKVMLKVPWWIMVHPQPDIMLKQKKLHTDPKKSEFGRVDYEESVDVTVTANFAGKLSVSIVPTDPDGTSLDAAKWYAKIEPADFEQCDNPVTITAGFEKGWLHNKQACDTLHVADLTISVKPKARPVECTPCP